MPGGNDVVISASNAGRFLRLSSSGGIEVHGNAVGFARGNGVHFSVVIENQGAAVSGDDAAQVGGVSDVRRSVEVCVDWCWV